MKYIYLIFMFFIFNSYATKPEKLLKNLNCKYLKSGVDLDSQDSLDLLFDYKIYKQIIKDNILDELIKKSGFEPNDENRMIFFAAISKDLQNQITKSFENNSCNSSTNILLAQDSLVSQVEMTRSLTSAVQAMALSISKPASSGKFWLGIGAVFFVLGAEFGWFKNFTKITDFYTNTKEKIVGVSEFLGRKLVENSFLKRYVYIDYLEDHKYVNKLGKEFGEIIKWLEEDKDGCKYDWLMNAGSIVLLKKGINLKDLLKIKKGDVNAYIWPIDLVSKKP